MKTKQNPYPSILVILSAMCLFWAYTVISTLLREFSTNVTFLDLAVLVALGFISGVAAGLIPWARKSGGH